ncbi:MAG: VCBS repeat-containing protein [Acutalibacteraceae bacterium]|nr:VCBS repeat-containing protein [Acutalibacteraceae bacterium]
MKIKNKFTAVVLLATFATTLHGCSFAGISDNDLLQPPKATGVKAEIQNVLETTTKGDYKLKYPQSGDYRSAIIMYDIDGNDGEEAIAFYKTGKDNASVNIIFMKDVGGKWEAIKSFTNANSEVDRVCFGDVDNDGCNEVIVGWSSYLTEGNQITLYNYNNDIIDQIVVNDDTTYTDMILMDITNDQVNDLVVLTSFADEKLSKTNTSARLYSSCINGKFSKVSEIPITSKIISYSQVLQGNISKNVKGLFIDGYTANQNEQLTEVLYYSDEIKSLAAPLYISDEDEKFENITLRNTATLCKDINSDGIIEIPSPYTPIISGYENTSCPINRWCKINLEDNSYIETEQTVASYSDGYYFVLPKEWYEKIAVVNDNTTRTTTFYEISDIKSSSKVPTENSTDIGSESATVPDLEKKDEESTELSTEKNTEQQIIEINNESLLTIKVFSEKVWENEKKERLAEGYNVLEQENGLVYTCKLGKSNSSGLNLSTEQVSSNFKLIQ